MVIEDKLDENSWEYQQIIDTLNYHIKTVESLSVDKVVDALSKYHNSPEEEQSVEMIQRKIDDQEVLKIVVDFIVVTHSLLRRNSKAQLAIFSLFKDFASESKRPKVSKLIEPQEAVNKLKSYKISLESKLRAA